MASSNREWLTLGGQEKKRRKERINDRREKSRRKMHFQCFFYIYYLKGQTVTSRDKVYLVNIKNNAETDGKRVKRVSSNNVIL